ncbi:tyrosine-type recombinase/integrase [Paraburkholderia sp. EB58]|uniref:tyrosine-type recombinase/integrase n=1 Tax=Paraburkholderia sp. EB58 TaxID=3035125 RepID=UPI003D230A66
MVSLAEDYLASRRRLGFDLRCSGRRLLDFARFSDRAGHQGPLTAPSRAWLQRRRVVPGSPLFGLIAATGLRISEALNLRRADVDLDHGLLMISETKYRKSRVVPLHPTVVQELGRYV